MIKIRNLLFVPIALILLGIGVIVDHWFISLVISVSFFIFTFLYVKEGLSLLFVYFPLRPFLIEVNPALKIIGDLVIFSALLKVIYQDQRRWKSLLHFYSFEIAFLLFLMIGSLSAYFIGGANIEAIFFQVRSFLLMYILFYILRRLSVTKEDILRLGWIVLTMVFILGVHGLIEKVSLRGMLLPESWKNMPLSATNRVRVYGLLGNPNSLALFMSLSLIFLYTLKEKVNKKIIINIAIVLALGTIVLTLSRGTWISFLVFISLFIVFSKKWSLLKHLVLSLIISIGIIVIPTTYYASIVEKTDIGIQQREIQKQYDESDETITDRIKGTFDEASIEGSRKSGRLYIIAKGFEVFSDHPIIGTGFGTYGDAATLSYGSPIYDQYDIYLRFYSDNQYIQILVQTGIVGSIFFAIFLLGMLIFVIKHRSKLPEANLSISFLIAIYILTFVYNSWESYILTLYYFTIFGYIVSKISVKKIKDV